MALSILFIFSSHNSFQRCLIVSFFKINCQKHNQRFQLCPIILTIKIIGLKPITFQLSITFTII